ncbi:NADH-ubiquinone oxidoreductase-F iron-sulfur binding region domain-containing protein [Nonomuraea turcica]|uniref:NADH-ubiquinone oxidoreductase-F iron-sulfur binding region domain-containing protein n=1 Tax=Nonomuraea sp. G32 TaxID=3067274 RepID=UPI00273B4AE8|nr:NADH-ubiquinone oxidoreductase-F iron-sulfur binding region domain-containing protein [Nonomuraea sp. G32]MDP4510016.1 NADH-ubiquinone oxidoreductase-F iron-sulfur binding region domain-containing protein [Nonomuraea sp. G32]
MQALAQAASETVAGPQAWAPEIARGFGLPAAAGLGPASFYADLAAGHGRRHVRVCVATACFAARGNRHLPEIEHALGLNRGESTPETSVQAVRCLGYCYAGPACLDSDTPCTGPKIAEQISGREPPYAPPIPVADATGEPVVLAGILAGQPAWRSWVETVGRRTPEQVASQVAASGLQGRGGAGFLVTDKWAAAGHSPDTVVIANGDEGDPGSYADRLLMEEDPGRVLEGLALACLACGARRGVVLVRSEYPRALARMRAAVAQAYEDGHLGAHVHGSDVDLDVEVVGGAGSYVSGEETALIAGLEGGRGCARARPPYPTSSGLWDAPTVVNNIETLAAIPWIVRHGGDAYARRGTPGEPGTKLVCLSERFARPGCYEVELGTPLRRIVTELGGGLRDGAQLAVLQVGGPLGGFLAEDELDVPLSGATLSRHGAALGHAGLVAIDHRPAPQDVLRHVWMFAAAESCGACSPCRVGSRRGLEMITVGDPPGEAYARMLNVMSQASLCAFGRRVPAAVRSLARAYGDRLRRWGG